MNLELRRQALEADGWKIVNTGALDGCVHPWFEWIRMDGTRTNMRWTTPDGVLAHCNSGLPAIESSPAAFWPWFLAWCDKNGYKECWMLMPSAGGFHFTIVRRSSEGSIDGGNDIDVRAATIEEAGCLAVVAAKGRK